MGRGSCCEQPGGASGAEVVEMKGEYREFLGGALECRRYALSGVGEYPSFAAPRRGLSLHDFDGIYRVVRYNAEAQRQRDLLMVGCLFSWMLARTNGDGARRGVQVLPLQPDDFAQPHRSADSKEAQVHHRNRLPGI